MQNKLIIEILDKIISLFEEEITKLKEQFNKNKLCAIFPETLNYHFNKLQELTYGIEKLYGTKMAELNLTVIIETFCKVKRGIEERYSSIDAIDTVKYLYEDIDYLLDQITQSIKNEDYIHNKNLKFFIECLEKRCNELKEVCKEIDEEI